MPAIITCLLFIAVPLGAALAFDIHAFVPLLILFCVLAGLCSAPGGADGRVSRWSDPDRLPPPPRALTI